MKEYHKIQTIFKRNTNLKGHPIMEGVCSMPEFGYLAKNKWIFTEKVDGTNIRVMFDGGSISYGGKTDNAQIPATLFKVLTDQFTPLLPRMLEIFSKDGEVFKDVCLYGEGYGAKIQKGGGNYRQDQGFVLFDIKIGEWWLQREDIEDIVQKLNLETVPIIGEGTLFDMVEIVRNGVKSQWGDFQAEGIVARPEIELQTRAGKRIITKIKHKDFK